MSRQIILDTETTGIGAGHRIIEIGCVEMIDRQLTGNHFHVYLNPDRAIDEGAFRVHGISREFLEDKPRFKDVLDEFLAFIKNSELIIHNAPFDTGFINVEFDLCKYTKKIQDICSVIDTLSMAKKKHPGQKNNLDALCKRYDVDNTNRTLHGALLDAEILASVYLAMTGGQISLFDKLLGEQESSSTASQFSYTPLTSTSPVIFATEEELQRHEEW